MRLNLSVKDWIEIIGVLGIILSLIFVGFQLQQDRTLFSSGAQMERMGPEIELQTAIIQNPEIWIKGNAGETLTDEELVVYEGTLRIYNDNTFYAFVSRRIRDGELEASRGLSGFSSFLASNPGAYKKWNEREIKLAKDRQIIFGDQLQGTGVPAYVNIIREQVERLLAAESP